MEKLETKLLNARELLELELGEQCFSTGVSEIDKLFGDGIPSGTFFEIVGCSSTGKTQLWYELSLHPSVSV